MLGAIIGDIVGSIYEFDNINTKDFEFFGKGAAYTDDSILTLATADWLLHGGNVAHYYAEYAAKNPCPMGGYGGMFAWWAQNAYSQGTYEPYNSCGNGSAMRVDPVGWYSDDKDVVMEKAHESAACTHNHPEGIKGAQATALCILMARLGKSKTDIRRAMKQEFHYDLSMPVEELQRRYSWQGIDSKGNGALCQESVPQAITCALEADSFEDAVRNAVSITGDSDTIGDIAGGIAEALYGIPRPIYDKGLSYLPERFQNLVREFEARYGNRVL